MQGLLLFLVSPQEVQYIEKAIYRSQEYCRRSCSNGTNKKDERSRSPLALLRTDNELKASIRLGSRVFVAGSVLLALVDRMRSGLRRPGKEKELNQAMTLRLPLSVSVLILLHRFLYRGISRLQLMLPHLPGGSVLKRTMMSPLTPSIAAALSGVSLAAVPSENVRVTIAVYVFTKTMEYLSNALQEVASMPQWFGAWLLFPFSFAQLFHALLTNQGSVPFVYRKILMTFPRMFATGSGIASASGSSRDQAALMGDIANLNFPAFKSTILFPKVPSASHNIDPVIRQAHPAIVQLSCAISHPRTVSCLHAYAEYILRQFGQNARILFTFNSLALLLKLQHFRKTPLPDIYQLISKTVKTSVFVTLTVASSWSTVCFLQKILPRRFRNHSCFYYTGFLGGLMAFFDRENSRSIFLDATRNGALSWWKANKRSRLLKNIPSADVLVFMISIAILNSLYDCKPTSITSNGARKIISLLRGCASVEKQPIASNTSSSLTENSK